MMTLGVLHAVVPPLAPFPFRGLAREPGIRGEQHAQRQQPEALPRALALGHGNCHIAAAGDVVGAFVAQNAVIQPDVLYYARS